LCFGSVFRFSDLIISHGFQFVKYFLKYFSNFFTTLFVAVLRAVFLLTFTSIAHHFFFVKCFLKYFFIFFTADFLRLVSPYIIGRNAAASGQHIAGAAVRTVPDLLIYNKWMTDSTAHRTAERTAGQKRTDKPPILLLCGYCVRLVWYALPVKCAPLRRADSLKRSAGQHMRKRRNIKNGMQSALMR